MGDAELPQMPFPFIVRSAAGAVFPIGGFFLCDECLKLTILFLPLRRGRWACKSIRKGFWWIFDKALCGRVVISVILKECFVIAAAFPPIYLLMLQFLVLVAVIAITASRTGKIVLVISFIVTLLWSLLHSYSSVKDGGIAAPVETMNRKHQGCDAWCRRFTTSV